MHIVLYVYRNVVIFKRLRTVGRTILVKIRTQAIV